MSEKDCNNCLKNKLYKITDDLKFESNANYIDQSHSGITSKTVILPLSLENNSTLAGTGVTLDQFGKEFSIPSVSKDEILPFDSNAKTFCLKKAREHAEFNILMSHHKEQNELYSSQLSDVEKNSEGKDVDEESSDISEGDDDNDSGNEDAEQTDRNRVSGPETTVNTVQTLFRKQDRVFNSTYDSLKNKLWNAIQTTTLGRFIKEISETEHVRTIRDHLGRSLLHMAVEQQNVNLVHCLLHAGVNPNLKEMCGVTPLIIAVITNNKEICKMLVNSQASVRGPLFTNIPSPLAVAMKMELEEIYELLDPSLSDQEDDDIASYDPGFK